MEFSFDRIVGLIGIGLAVLGIIIGIGVAVAMDPKSKGEMIVSISCFIFSGLTLCLTVGVWAFITEIPLAKRILIGGPCFALIFISMIEASRWVQTRYHPRQAEGIKQSEFAVYQPFQSAYSIYKNKLGDPIEEAEPAGVASYIVHQRSVVIWLEATQEHYIIHNSGDWRSLPDANAVSEKEWFLDDLLASKFPNVTPGKRPPLGGIARNWWNSTHKEEWLEELGWREWDCNFPGKHRGWEDDIYFQRFANGYMIGILPAVNPLDPEKAQLQRGAVFILTSDDHRWTAPASESLRPPRRCEQYGWHLKPLPTSIANDKPPHETPKVKQSDSKPAPLQKPIQNAMPEQVPPTVMQLRISQESAVSDKPDFPFAQKVVIQTNVRIQPVSIVFEFTAPIGLGNVWFGGEQGVIFLKERSGFLVANPKMYIASFESPAFEPDKAMIITVYSKEQIQATGRWQQVPFTFP